MRKIIVLFAVLFLLSQLAIAQDFATPQELADDNGQFITANDAEIYYIAEGNPEDPAVVFIHGFGGSTFTWRDVLAPVAEAGFYALALDLPPFGLSDKNPELNYARSGMADTVAAWMDALNISQATIVGHSMGGSVTAQFAVRHPEKVTQLVFVAGGIAPELSARTDESSQDEQSASPLGLLDTIDPSAPAAPILIRALVNRGFFEDSLSSAYYDANLVTDEAIDGYARLLQIENAPAGFLAYVQARETELITLEDLSQSVNYPIQIIWGIQDTWVPLEVGLAMADALPNVTLVTYDETGHLPMEERSSIFVEDLLAFLQGE
jgi:pimeloyl-ACP methyl ester carboxylesterase